jgi:prenyltransferase beta subunit
VGSTQATRDLYVDYIINAQLENGGWSLMGGEAEIDLTAMALQALAKYQDRKDVADAVEKGLAILSDRQNENGGYQFSASEQVSCESVAQVIVALAELGISLDDPRFVKNGKTLLDGILQFQRSDGGFSHLMEGETDLLATEQAFYALVAANRIAQGESSLYRMK